MFNQSLLHLIVVLVTFYILPLSPPSRLPSDIGFLKSKATCLVECSHILDLSDCFLVVFILYLQATVLPEKVGSKGWVIFSCVFFLLFGCFGLDAPVYIMVIQNMRHRNDLNEVWSFWLWRYSPDLSILSKMVFPTFAISN